MISSKNSWLNKILGIWQKLAHTCATLCEMAQHSSCKGLQKCKFGQPNFAYRQNVIRKSDVQLNLGR